VVAKPPDRVQPADVLAFITAQRTGRAGEGGVRSLKRRISDAIYAALVADARQAAAAGTKGPGGQPGNLSVSRAAGSHPAHRLFGQATPGPATTIRPGATAGRAPSRGVTKKRAPRRQIVDLVYP
jgi:hypothetical protein